MADISGEVKNLVGQSVSNAIEVEKTREQLNSAKASFQGLMKELAQSSASIEGDVAGKTSNTEDLYKFIQKVTATLDFNDPNKLTDLGKIPITNRTSTGRFDKEGYGEVYGHCEECGKPLKKPSKDGMCSLTCAMKHNAANISGEIKSLVEKGENLEPKLDSIVQLTNTFTNQISETIEEIDALPGRMLDPSWEVYFKVRLANLKIYLKRNINELLIDKNNWMMHQADKGKNLLGGDVFNSLGPMSKIKKAADAAQKLCDQMNALYDKAYQSVVYSLSQWKLEPESMNFNSTIRSNTYFPGKFAVKLANNNTPDSVANVNDTDKIFGVVESAFPHLTQEEMTLSPGAFNAKKLHSEYNVRGIKKMINTLMPLTKMGSEPLPRYEDLKITNVWWMIFLMSSFLPQGQKHYALPFAP